MVFFGGVLHFYVYHTRRFFCFLVSSYEDGLAMVIGVTRVFTRRRFIVFVARGGQASFVTRTMFDGRVTTGLDYTLGIT